MVVEKKSCLFFFNKVFHCFSNPEISNTGCNNIAENNCFPNGDNGEMKDLCCNVTEWKGKDECFEKEYPKSWP